MRRKTELLLILIKRNVHYIFKILTNINFKSKNYEKNPGKFHNFLFPNRKNSNKLLNKKNFNENKNEKIEL